MLENGKRRLRATFWKCAPNRGVKEKLTGRTNEQYPAILQLSPANKEASTGV